MTRWRRSLKGGVENRTTACKKASQYLAACRLESPVSVPLPSQLNSVVADLRTNAGNIRTKASERLASCERLLRIEGYSFAPHGCDPLDQLLDREFGMSAPDKPESTSVQRVRERARRQALYEVQKNFLRDHNEGRFAGMKAEQVAEWLRLDGTEPAPKPDDPLKEFNAALEAVLARVKEEKSDGTGTATNTAELRGIHPATQ